MGRIVRFWRWRGPRRLKGLDEFETPEFVGRMSRVERRRRLAWLALVGGGFAIGVGLGLTLIR